MKTVFKGDLTNFAGPAIGQRVLNFLIEEAKLSKKVVARSLIVSVAGKTITAAGSYDPGSDTLTVTGYV